MDEKQGFPFAIAISCGVTVFAAVIIVACVYYRPARNDRHPRMDPRVEKLSAAIKTHPDPEVARDFAGTDGLGGVQMDVEALEYDDGQFSVVGGHPTLTIKTSIMDEAITAQGLQKLWGILSHEHEHYRQWVEGESFAYMSAPRPLTETGCTLTVTLEVGAYAKTCRDARKYGWDSVEYQCEAISLKRIAEEKLAHELARAPECGDVWRTFSGENPPRIIPVQIAPQRPVAPPQQQAPHPSGAIYLAPP